MTPKRTVTILFKYLSIFFSSIELHVYKFGARAYSFSRPCTTPGSTQIHFPSLIQSQLGQVQSSCHVTAGYWLSSNWPLWTWAPPNAVSVKRKREVTSVTALKMTLCLKAAFLSVPFPRRILYLQHCKWGCLSRNNSSYSCHQVSDRLPIQP